MTSPKSATATFQPSEYALNVSHSGLYGASGTVSGPGIACTTGPTTGCSTSVANGATVTLVAEPAPGSFFKSWSGCTGERRDLHRLHDRREDCRPRRSS